MGLPDASETLRQDDERCSELDAAGWRIVATSWGARLRIGDDDKPRLLGLVDSARDRGYEIVELTARDAGQVHALESATQVHYFQSGPATAHPLMTRNEAVALFGKRRVFGVKKDGALVAVTATYVLDDWIETDFTSVHAAHRGQGLGRAVEAASVLAHVEQGWRIFGTGGSEINEASLAMNFAVGYQLTETWCTYEPPA